MSKVSPIVRHLVLAVITVTLSWALTDLVPFLNGQTGYGALLGALIAAAVAYFTPLVNSYGVGASRINYGVTGIRTHIPSATDL